MLAAPPPPKKVRTLIVDDTALYRRAVADAMSTIDGVEVLGTASNGRLALARLEELHPDLMTLDMEMPELNGIEVLEAISSWRSRPGVIVLSSHTVKGGSLTMKALELGAFDFVTKPEGGSTGRTSETLKAHLAPVVQAFVSRSRSKSSAGPGLDAGLRSASRAVSTGSPLARPANSRPKRLIAVGVSTGGPQALSQILPQLPGTLSVPILIVQHMPPIFTEALAESLERKSTIKVKQAEDGEIARAGVAYIAPGGCQMKVKSGPAGEIRIVVNHDPAENHCRPSVDYLFRSVALQFPGASIGLVLTGMGADGAQGIRLLKKTGAVTLAQDESTSVVFGMPREAVATGAVDEVVALPEVASRLVSIIEQGGC